MTLLSDLREFGPLDLLALVFLFGAWLGIGWRIEWSGASRKSVSVLMQSYRREWLHHYVTRQPRIFDSSILASMRQGITFFASSCIIAIGGGLALIGNPDRLTGIADDLALQETPAAVWEIKVLAILFFLLSGFLHFVWSHRLFGYCAVIMASVPNDPAEPLAYPRAAKAAEINILAARSFNRGMRAIYFALGAATWLLGSVALIIGTAVALGVVWRREFASRSREVLLRPDL